MALSQQPVMVYEHTQSVASDTWVIVHNLKLYPAIDVFIDYLGEVQKVLPQSIQYTDVNTCTVIFSEAQTGKATVA